MHSQLSLLKYGCDDSGKYPITSALSENGFYLPSGSSLAKKQIEYIADKIIEFYKK